MKRFTLLFMLMGIIFGTYAQTEGEANTTEDCHIVVALKRQYIQDSLQLTDKEAKDFWPAYNNFDISDVEIHESFSKFLEDNGIKSVRGKVKLSDLPSDKAIIFLEKKMKFKSDLNSLENSFFNKLKKILPPEKVVRYYELEGNFKREVLQKYGKRGSKKEPLPVKKRR